LPDEYKFSHLTVMTKDISVEEANAAFYRAIESNDIELMDEVWAHESWIKCVHPGWEMISGWRRVRESWSRIFEDEQRMRISPSSISVHTEGDFAWVTCLENITVFEETSFDSVQAAATNLFIRRDGSWLMVHHHASPIPMIVADTSSDTIQ
jgi:ketosteroid isomerase-like protein